MRYLLAGFDGSVRSRAAVLRATDIANRYCARLHVLMVAALPGSGIDVPIGDDMVDEYLSVATAQLESLSSELQTRSAHYTLRLGEPAQQIASYALEFDVRQVFLGPSRPMIPRILSTGWRVRRLLAETDCEVVIVTAAMPGALV